MSLQKDATMTRQALQLCIVDSDNLWTLEGLTRILKMGNPSASTASNTGI